jgi:ketosteroid isomerase-like protein
VSTPDLALVAERLAVHDLLAGYARAVDTDDLDALDGIFTDDAVVDYTSSGGPRDSLERVRSWLRQVLAPFGMRQHLLTNIQVDFDQDGRSADVTAYLMNPMGFRDDGGTPRMFLTGGCYRARVRRTPDGWRLAELVQEQAWIQHFPPG